MKQWFLIALILLGGYKFWEAANAPSPVAPLLAEPYVAVYGRDSCGWTQKMLGDLRSSGMAFHYFSVDEKAIADELHSRMQASGLSTRRYNLPVVDVNGVISVRPDFGEVRSQYYRDSGN